MRIAIAGAGWYGCHIASVLKNQCDELVLYEKNSMPLSEASGNNQFRLHQGLHYPRSSETRHQSRDGYQRFSERYSAFAKDIHQNYYLIPLTESIIDFDTYFSIMLSSGLKIEKTPIQNIPFITPDKIEGAIKCFEKVILTEKARDYFLANLNENLSLNQTVRKVENRDSKVLINDCEYDCFIDATWGALYAGNTRIVYQATILLYYEYLSEDIFPAITLMDGQLWSIYPTEKPNIYTLSSVPFTPIANCSTKSEAYNIISKVNDRTIKEKIGLMEAQVEEYFPEFKRRFKYLSPQLSIKTKPLGRNDNRAASVQKNGRCYYIQSGKIDNIFYAADYISGEITSGLV